MAEIPLGFCQCGCGEKTRIPKYNDKKNGQVRGEPLKFISGHNNRGKNHNNMGNFRGAHPNWKGGQHIDAQGRRKTYAPDHPRSHCGYVLEHILIAEKALGKFLPQGSQVHHFTPEQLVICQDDGYHKLLHRRQRAYEACGHTVWRKCKFCHEYDDPASLTTASNGDIYHLTCKRGYDREYNLKRQSNNHQEGRP